MTKDILIGRHIGLAEKFDETPLIAHSYGYNIMQIFVSSPVQFVAKQRTDEELKKFKQRLEKYNIKLVIHSAYLINLCNDSPYIRSLIRDLHTCERLNGIGCIIHMGHMNKKLIEETTDLELFEDLALETYINNIKKVIQETSKLKSLIILETGASMGYEAGSKMNKMGKIYQGLSKEEKKRVGFCIDTCHIWVTGYDISDKKKVDEFLKYFDQEIGLENLKVIHFNDSFYPLNSKKDRHMNIGHGQIPIEGLKAMFNYAINKKIPIVMETPSGRAIDYDSKEAVTFEDDFKTLKEWLNEKNKK